MQQFGRYKQVAITPLCIELGSAILLCYIADPKVAE